jgi:hypothetical protein
VTFSFVTGGVPHSLRPALRACAYVASLSSLSHSGLLFVSMSMCEVCMALLWWGELVEKAWALVEAHEVHTPVRDVHAMVEVVPAESRVGGWNEGI